MTESKQNTTPSKLTTTDIKLNIPGAAELHGVRYGKKVDDENQIIQKQAQIIENALNNFDGKTDEITITLDEKLRRPLFNQLLDKGFDVYQLKVRDFGTEQSSKWTLTINFTNPCQNTCKCDYNSYIPYLPYRPYRPFRPFNSYLLGNLFF